MKKGYRIAIILLVLVLIALCGAIYFDLFHGKDSAQQPIPVDMADFAQAIQEIEDSQSFAGHLWILKEDAYDPTQFRFEHSPTFTAEILKEDKVACLHAFYETDTLTVKGYYDLYYDKGWKVELTDGKPVMIIEEVTYNPDLTKSVEVVYGPADENIRPTANQLDAVKEVIEKRLVAQNITDYEIYADVAKGQVTVNFPWLNPEKDPEDLVADLGKTGMLQFYEGNSTYDDGSPKGTLILDGTDVKSAEAMVNQDATNATSPYVISLKFNDAGTAKFAAVTERLAASKSIISIWLDFGEEWATLHNQSRYQLLSAPTVESQITGGEAIITGFAAYEDAKEIADLITSGTLPFDITDRSLNISN